MRILGERWSQLSASEKRPFEELAQADKERYIKEIENMNASGL